MGRGGLCCWHGESEALVYAPRKPPCRKRSTTHEVWSGSLWGCVLSPAHNVIEEGEKKKRSGTEISAEGGRVLHVMKLALKTCRTEPSSGKRCWNVYDATGTWLILKPAPLTHFLCFQPYLSVGWLVYWQDFPKTTGRISVKLMAGGWVMTHGKRSLNVGTNLDKEAGLGVLITLINIVNLDRKIQEYGRCRYPWGCARRCVNHTPLLLISSSTCLKPLLARKAMVSV